MKLMRVGPAGHERPAAAAGVDTYVDLSDVFDDLDSSFWESDGPARARTLIEERIARNEVESLEGQRVGAPVARPHQILCIGLNYADHAAESGMEVPAEPVVFTKAPNTLIGPYDDVEVPRGATKTDWEVELALVIGRRCSYLDSPEEASDYIAGYAVANDVSERSFQLERGGQWCKGKSAATFNPMGPWLVTPDEIADVGDLAMRLDVNDQPRQRGSTSTMVFDPHHIVYHLSQFFVLEPGDVVNTGTPPGVGMGFDPPVYLVPGDVMSLGIEGLGEQQQQVVPHRRN